MSDIFVPQPSPGMADGDTDAYGVTWVTVQHPDLGSVTHRIPVDALEGFRESGWDLVPAEKGKPVKAGQFIGSTAPRNDQSAAVDNDDTPKE